MINGKLATVNENKGNAAMILFKYLMETEKFEIESNTGILFSFIFGKWIWSLAIYDEGSSTSLLMCFTIPILNNIKITEGNQTGYKTQKGF